MATRTKESNSFQPLFRPGDAYSWTYTYDGITRPTSSPYGNDYTYTSSLNTPGVCDCKEITYETGPKEAIQVIRGVSVKVPFFKEVTHNTARRFYEPCTVPFLPPWYYNGNLYTCTISPIPANPVNCFHPDTVTGVGYWRANALPNHTSIINAYISNAATALIDLRSDAKLLGFRDAFSVMTFIAELKDIRSLPNLIKKWTRTSHDVSDKFLGVSFGVLPFYSDLISILDRLKKLSPAVDKWNDLASKGKILNGHRRISPPLLVKNHSGYEVLDDKRERIHVPEFEAFSIDASYAGKDIGHTYFVECDTYITAKAHLYYVPQHLPVDLQDDIKREIWGVNTPLASAWELIPFSFVVDWFTNIGDMIHRFESNKPLLQVHVLASGYSVKLDSTYKVRVERQGVTIGTFVHKYKTYVRKRLDPSSVYSDGTKFGALEFQTAGSDKLLLGSALLHQLLK